MALLNKKRLNLFFGTPWAIDADSVPYDASTSIKDMLDRLTLDVADFETLLPRNCDYNMYKEFTKVGWKYTQIDFWDTSAKGTKTFTKEITYTGNNPTTIVMTNEISWQTLTTTIVWSWNSPENVTKVLS